ncbi:MAG: type IV pilus twitching motility protein PilT [Candidatus Gottesmanbacteria bacterium]|nr:type IV pilus twitching motility protein PilT [Candidatus Gottesmanbacteria bacterium]
MDIQQLFSEAARLEANDLHFIVGFPPMMRVSGKLAPIPSESVLTSQDTEGLATGVLTPEQKELLTTNKEIDLSVTSDTGRFRTNLYYQQGTIAASFRLIPAKIKTIDELGLPAICHEFVKLRQGLVLVTGPTGHGKSTTLAAMINTINMKTANHIVTVEDPIEFIYPKGLSIVSQREMHSDTHSWNAALRSSLREDPDVVLVGEMRDYETIAAALTVAETGHLVFATLHTNSAAQSIDRIVDVFPENQQPQVRMQLSSVLEGILAQRLIPAAGGGRVAIAEVLTASPAVRTTIREGKSHLVDNIIQTSGELGMMLLETALAKAVKEGKISAETAISYALRPEDMNRLLKGM